MSEEQKPKEEALTLDDIQRIIVGDEKYKVLNVINGIIRENVSLRKQVEALTAKPSEEDQKYVFQLDVLHVFLLDLPNENQELVYWLRSCRHLLWPPTFF